MATTRSPGRDRLGSRTLVSASSPALLSRVLMVDDGTVQRRPGAPTPGSRQRDRWAEIKRRENGIRLREWRSLSPWWCGRNRGWPRAEAPSAEEARGGETRPSRAEPGGRRPAGASPASGRCLRPPQPCGPGAAGRPPPAQVRSAGAGRCGSERRAGDN